MVNSKDDKGAESEGYEKPTAKSTNTHKLKSIQVTLQQKQTPTSTNPQKQTTKSLKVTQSPQQHRTSLVISKLRADGEFTG